MIKLLFVSALVIALTCPAYSQTRSKRIKPGARSGAGVEESLKKQEQQWLDAIKRRDIAALDRIMAKGYVATNIDGTLADKAQMLEAIISGELTVEPSNPDDFRASVYGTTAVVTGRASLKPKAGEAARPVRHTQVWLMRQGRWQIVAWQATAVTSAKAGSEVTTASGLKYIDIVVGTGESPKQGQMITVHYTGRLEDGTKFDSSVDRGEPFTFQIGVGRVIRGWDEGVMSMKVGGKRRLIIPSDLGYGARGAGRVIPPNATLIFEVELLRVN